MQSKAKWIILVLVVLGGLIMALKKMLRPFDTAIRKMAYAIMDWEEYLKPGSVSRTGKYYPDGTPSYRNNNPGNLKYHGQKGATGQDSQGHAIFESFQAGWNALIKQLELAFYGGSEVYSLNDTLYSFFGHYAEANSANYAKAVADALGISPDTKLGDIRL